MSAATFDAEVVTPAWKALQASLPARLGAIGDDAQYEEALTLLNGLLDVVGDNEDHELASFLDLVGQLIADYETRRHVLPAAPAADVLRLLMQAHGLRQIDLAAELGGQSTASAILLGKREINARQARALAIRFGVSPAAFL
jgi:HTH-type transcriptional regulator/antitoxin HigA